MTRHLTLALTVAGAVAFALAGARAQEAKYEIKFKNPNTAERLKSEVSVEELIKRKVSDAQGNALEDVNTKKIEFDEFEEIIQEVSKDGKDVLKTKLQYGKAWVAKDKDKRERSFAAKTLLIEKKDKKYEFKLEDGKELHEEDIKDLDERFNDKAEDVDLDKLLTPGKAVAVGESWKVDLKPLIKDLAKRGLEVDEGKSDGTTTLTKVFKQDGRLHGQFKLRLLFPLKSATSEGIKIALTDSKAEMSAEFSRCIDGARVDKEETSTMRMIMNGTFADAQGKKYEIKADVTVKYTGKNVEVVKK